MIEFCPAAEFIADRGQIAHLTEAEPFVQLDRGDVGAVDVADHLAKARRGAGVHQRGHKLTADPCMQPVATHVDRMLDRIAIGGPLAERHRVGVADHRSRLLRNQMRHLAIVHRSAPPLEIVGVGGLELAVDAGVHSAPDVVQVDGEHRRHIGVARVAH